MVRSPVIALAPEDTPACEIGDVPPCVILTVRLSVVESFGTPEEPFTKPMLGDQSAL